MAKKLKVETICERELLEKILRIVERQEKLPSANKVVAHCLYDNKSLMAKLGIKEKYLKKLVHAGGCGPIFTSLPF